MEAPTGPYERSLSEYSLPRALAELAAREADGTLTLTHRNLEKRIIIREGVPVFAESNIAEETLGQSLVKRGVIDLAVAHEALNQSIAEGRYIGETLVKMGVLSPNELFQAIKRTVGTCILDAFRWSEGQIAFDDAEPDVENKILLKIDPASLVLRGVARFSPFKLLYRDLADTIDVSYQMRPDILRDRKGFNLNGVESRLELQFREPHTIAELCIATSVDENVAFRFVYAMVVLGFAADAERVAGEAETVAEEPRIQETPVESKGPEPLAEEDAQAIDQAYLESKSQSFFAVLGVGEEPQFAELRRAFLEKCDRFSPMSFKGVDLGDRDDIVQQLFLRYVRAFATLSDSDHRAAYKKTVASKARSAQEARSQPPERVANPFAIKTRLLDANHHVENGKRLFDGNNPGQAIDHFEFALDIEPENPEALAYLGYSMHCVDAVGKYSEAVERIDQAIKLKPDYALPYFFMGRIHELSQDRDQAGIFYSRCLRYDPDNKEARKALDRLRSKKRK